MAKARWDTCLIKNKQGAYLPCLSNATAILTHRDEWYNTIAFDAFAGTVIKKKRPPWVDDTVPDIDTLGDWTHEDTLRTSVWLTREYNCTFPTYVVDEAIRLVADRWAIHPVRDYLNAVRWDKKPRIDDLLIRVAGADDNAYVRAVTKSFFIAAVARIFWPGAKVDTMLILEGDQGLGKSTLLRILAGEAWFMDTSFAPGTKDGYQQLRRKWIIEWGELDALSRADLSRVKAFITSVKDTYRPSYGRTVVDFYRQCIFAGTINPGDVGYLTDPTGARRFWPIILTTKIDFKMVREERDQLWAEAVVRYRKNEPWHLNDPKLLKVAAKEAEERREIHPWEAHFQKWLTEHDRTKRGVTIEELLTKAVDMPKDRQGRHAHTEAGKALRAIGWTIVQRTRPDLVRRHFPAEAVGSVGSVGSPKRPVSSPSMTDPTDPTGSKRKVYREKSVGKGRGSRGSI